MIISKSKLLIFFCFFLISPSLLGDKMHGIAMHGLPIHSIKESHLPYVNPNANKG